MKYKNPIQSMRKDMNALRPHKHQKPLEIHDDIKTYLPPSVSRLSQEWLVHIEQQQNIRLLRGDVEYHIPKTRYRVDGFHPETKTIYEFYGDYWHGNPRLYSPYQHNIVVNRSFGTLYKLTLEREQTLSSLGYHVITMWEYDWLHRKR